MNSRDVADRAIAFIVDEIIEHAEVSDMILNYAPEQEYKEDDLYEVMKLPTILEYDQKVRHLRNFHSHDDDETIFRFIDDPVEKMTDQNKRRYTLSKYAKLENTLQLHYPSSNYVGPGTHVISNILDDKMPTDINEAAAMLHDISYLQNAGYGQELQDLKTIFQTDPLTLKGIAMISGLTQKNLLGYKSPVHLGGLKDEEIRNVGNILSDYVTNDPLYSNILNEYGLLPKSVNYGNRLLTK
jgi:hypothetical protein